ncbi:hypothetical protein BaRGS_00016584 [Batillaria attramentaria]|uniref:Mutator-like transposase domain-containing protein n=1 Tax=Batillaria attramentaria TaxID=370345 RepID=A0ABD0KY84_9CAEN
MVVCTATLGDVQPLSEEALGEEFGRQITEAGTHIEHITTDGDAKSAKGVETAMQSVFPGSTVERQADPVHLEDNDKAPCYCPRHQQWRRSSCTRAAGKSWGGDQPGHGQVPAKQAEGVFISERLQQPSDDFRRVTGLVYERRW